MPAARPSPVQHSALSQRLICRTRKKRFGGTRAEIAAASTLFEFAIRRGPGARASGVLTRSTHRVQLPGRVLFEPFNTRATTSRAGPRPVSVAQTSFLMGPEHADQQGVLNGSTLVLQSSLAHRSQEARRLSADADGQVLNGSTQPAPAAQGDARAVPIGERSQRLELGFNAGLASEHGQLPNCRRVRQLLPSAGAEPDASNAATNREPASIGYSRRMQRPRIKEGRRFSVSCEPRKLRHLVLERLTRVG